VVTQGRIEPLSAPRLHNLLSTEQYAESGRNGRGVSSVVSGVPFTISPVTVPASDHRDARSFIFAGGIRIDTKIRGHAFSRIDRTFCPREASLARFSRIRDARRGLIRFSSLSLSLYLSISRERERIWDDRSGVQSGEEKCRRGGGKTAPRRSSRGTSQ